MRTWLAMGMLLFATSADALTFTEIGVERYLGSDGIVYTLGEVIALGWSPTPPSPPPPPPPPPPAPMPQGCNVQGELDTSSLAAIGDSITALGWPEMLVFWRPSLVVHNLGVSGNTSAQMLARVNDALATGADTVSLGPCCWNDAANGVPVATTVANVRAMIQTLQMAGRRVVLVGPAPGGQGVDQAPWRVALLALANETCTIYVPIWNALINPDVPNSMLPTLRAEGVHPNAEGSRRGIAEPFARRVGW